MKDGRITQCGKYTDILTSGTDFMELVGAHKKALPGLDMDEGGSGTMNEDSNKASDENIVKPENVDGPDGKTDIVLKEKGQLVQEEEREKGKVGFPVYWRFITMAYGGALVPLILLAQILFQCLQIGSNYWMAWVMPLSKDVAPPVSSITLILVYVGLAVGSSLCILSRATLLATAGYKTATLFFQKMHVAIFRAPMSFFDATPSGRILNRRCLRIKVQWIQAFNIKLGPLPLL